MRTHTTKALLKESLEGFYSDSGKAFWEVFADTPLAAAAAFKERPEVFSRFARPYDRSVRMRAREQARISLLIDLVLQQPQVGAQWPPV